MTVLKIILYSFLIFLSVVGIVVFIRAYIVIGKLEETLKRINNTIDSVNGDLPIIVENIRESSRRANNLLLNFENTGRKISRNAAWVSTLASIVKNYFDIRKRKKEVSKNG